MHFLNYRIVKLIHPCKSKDGDLTCVSSLKVHLKDKSNTIYDTVAHFEKELGSKIKKTVEEVKELVLDHIIKKNTKHYQQHYRSRS